MIAFKVVEKRTRFGSNLAICRASHHGSAFSNVIKAFKRKYPQFFPRYLKGSIVKKAVGTVGILTFKTWYDAERFACSLSAWRSLKIIKVKGIGKPKEEVWLIGNCGSDPTNLLNAGEEVPAPTGTLAFPTVRVLE
ncbi:MAG: hypothetical protein KAQ81_03565 [Deltaproteobacteria bacterium]|nr:hypothetical protein [Deltaproteobacteria bacterium]